MNVRNLKLPWTTSFKEGERGYTLYLGRLRISQSTYLLLGAIAIGVGGGYGAVLFRAIIAAAGQLAGHLTFLLGSYLGVTALLVVMASGGALAAWITARFAPEARGHGVPEVMSAVALHGGIMRPRVILVKALASATTIGFGGAAGREGPIVQIGCTIGSVLGQLARAPVAIMRTLVACGAAAGISATFNAPIGGVFFASEVILGDFAPRSFSVIVVSSVVSAVIGRSQLGNHPSFNAAGFTLVSPNELWLYALLGVIAAIWATAFVKLLYACEDVADAIKIPSVLKGAIGFAAVGAIGLAFPQILGVGYPAMQNVLNSHVGFERAFELAVLKPLATSITLGAGGSGGVFAPSLFTGAMLGDAFGRLVHDFFPAWTADASAYGLVAMAAVFAAAAEAPITAILIVFEMSADYKIILPLMICTVIATIIGRYLLRSTVYEMKLERRGINWKRVRHPHPLSGILAKNMSSSLHYLTDGSQLAQDVLRDLDGNEEAVFVVDANRTIGVVGVVALAKRAAADPLVTVGELTEKCTEVLTPDDSLDRAATLFAQTNQLLIPIVDASGQITGIVNRRDVITAFESARG